MSIRYDDKLNNYIKKIITSYNAKRNRQIKKGNLLTPERVTIRDLKNEFTNRKELKIRLKELELYTKRGSEKTITLPKADTTLTKYEFDLIKKRTSRMKRQLTYELKRMEKMHGSSLGKEDFEPLAKTEYTKYMIEKKRREKLDRNILKMDKDSYKRQIDFIESELYRLSTRKAETFRKNYYKMLFELAKTSGVSEKKQNHIKRKLDKLSLDNFVKFFNNEKYIKAIVDYYPTIELGIAETNGSDISNIYDELYNNIDELVKDYE